MAGLKGNGQTRRWLEGEYLKTVLRRGSEYVRTFFFYKLEKEEKSEYRIIYRQHDSTSVL